MKPKIGQTAIFGPNTNMIGVVSAVRKNGFYVRHTTGYPTKPGGRVAAYRSTFFTFDQIGPNGYHNQGVTLR